MTTISGFKCLEKIAAWRTATEASLYLNSPIPPECYHITFEKLSAI